MNKFLLVLKIIFYPFYRLLFWYSVDGLENIPNDRGVIFCSNHISNIDPVLWIIVVRRRLCFMAKKELFKNPLLGWFLGRVGVFGVDRGGRDIGAIKKSIRIVRAGDILGIYPEGTRSKDGKPGKAKTGVAYIAHSCKCDVVPAAVKCNGKLRPFKRVKMVVGETIPYEHIKNSASKEELQKTADMIMERISQLWEQI